MIITSPYAAKLDAIPVTESTVQIGGSSTRYWQYGPADAETTIVMVHGFRGDHHGLEPFVAHLPGYRIVMPDLPGFGESTPLDVEHNIDGYAAWLIDFVAAVRGDGSTVILGHSFGSIVVSGAIAAGLDADRIVLVNPIAAPALQGPRGLMTRLAVFYYWASAKLPESVGFALLKNPLIVRVMSITMAKTKDSSLRRWIHNQHDRYFSAFSNRDVVLEAFQASVSNTVSQFAPSFTKPTLMIVADRDDITPVAAQRELHAKLAGSELVILTDVGHLVHYETPAQATNALSAFLERVPTDPAKVDSSAAKPVSS